MHGHKKTAKRGVSALISGLPNPYRAIERDRVSIARMHGWGQQVACVDGVVFCNYDKAMHRLIWDEAKRQSNYAKHRLDFKDAPEVLASNYRMDIETRRGSEVRTLSMSYVMGVLTVLAVVHTQRGALIRIISFRRASKQEKEMYRAWLENPDA